MIVEGVVFHFSCNAASSSLILLTKIKRKLIGPPDEHHKKFTKPI